MSARSSCYRLIRYHRRGWCGRRTTSAVSIADHVCGALVHSGSAARTSLVTPPARRSSIRRRYPIALTPHCSSHHCSDPERADLIRQSPPGDGAYGAGDHETAVELFLSVVSGLRETCRALTTEHAPGAVTQAIKDADTLFGVELPALVAWRPGPRAPPSDSQSFLCCAAMRSYGGLTWRGRFGPGLRRWKSSPCRGSGIYSSCRTHSRLYAAWRHFSLATR